MFPRVEDKEIEIIGADQLTSELREVVADLDDRMPEGSSVVVQVTSTLPRWILEEHLRHNHFVTSPNTWLLGATVGNSPSLRHGLFCKLDGFYRSDYAGRILGLEGKALNWSSFGHMHEGLDIGELTGRTKGTVSVILARRYLEKCFVVDFEEALVRDLKLPDRLVDYPLGDARYYIAKGEVFLRAYAQYAKDHDIRTNLSDTTKS